MNAIPISRVLILDDDPLMLRLLSRLLAGLGIPAVRTSTSGAEALAELARDSADLVLSDLNMPAMNGVEFVRHLGEAGYRGALALVSGEDERLLDTVDALWPGLTASTSWDTCRSRCGRNTSIACSRTGTGAGRRPRPGATDRTSCAAPLPAGNWSTTTSPRWT